MDDYKIVKHNQKKHEELMTEHTSTFYDQRHLCLLWHTAPAVNYQNNRHVVS